MMSDKREYLSDSVGMSWEGNQFYNSEYYETPPCPQCGAAGDIVAPETVRSIIKKKYLQHLPNDRFYICKTDDCGIGYYTHREQIGIPWQTFKRQPWFKLGVEDKIICNCHSISEQQIIDRVIETKLVHVQDLMNDLGGRLKYNCEVMNPTGRCCNMDFYRTIMKALEVKEVLRSEGVERVDSINLKPSDPDSDPRTCC